MLTSVVSICAIYFTVYKNGFVESKISYATYRSEMTRATPYEPYGNECFVLNIKRMTFVLL